MKNIEIRKGLREALWSASDFVGALKAETRLPHSKAAAPQLKSRWLSVGLLFAVASASAALDPQAIDDVLSQTVARQRTDCRAVLR
jgi:hypothetical protein